MEIKPAPVLTAEKLTDILREKMSLDEFIEISDGQNQLEVGIALTHAVIAMNDSAHEYYLKEIQGAVEARDAEWKNEFKRQTGKRAKLREYYHSKVIPEAVEQERKKYESMGLYTKQFKETPTLSGDGMYRSFEYIPLSEALESSEEK